MRRALPFGAGPAVAAILLAWSALPADAAPTPDLNPADESASIAAPPDETAPEADEGGDDRALPAIPAVDVPVVFYDPDMLPTPVRRLREQIIEAAATGDPEKLRPIFDAQDRPPDLGPTDVDDPIAWLVSLSGDAEGREILAIIIEVLEAGFVHVDVGTPDEMYLWPYFARYPVDELTPPQLVELFKLVYAGDYEDMIAYGFYTSFRAGISPDGTWRYFFTD
jgi:hypothetical protein